MDERGYSRPLDVHRISEYPEVQRMINSLFEEMKSAGLIGKSPPKKLLKHLKVVVLDLYIAHLHDPLVYLGYSRASGSYSKGTRLDQLFLGYRPMMRVIDGLESLGYLESHKGFFDRARQTGFQSRMRATSRLIDLINNYEFVPSIISREESDFIVLRDQETKEDIPFDDTEEIVRMREELRSYNTFLKGHKVGLSMSPDKIRELIIERRCPAIDDTRNSLYRIFNGDFTSGGRFYRGWWQNIPRDIRTHLTIDGEPCSELDYSGQHLLLLYAHEEDEYRWIKGKDDDPYTLQGYGDEVRDLLKVATLILVNATGRHQAFQAIRDKIYYDFPDLEPTTAFINPLIDAMLDKHSMVRHLFFSGRGRALQFKDSQIAAYVLTHMQAHGYVALPVHDSFVAQDRHLGQLYSLMKEAYRMLGVESIPEIKIKKGAHTTFAEPYFKSLWQEIDKDKLLKKNEIEAIKALEDIETLE